MLETGASLLFDDVEAQDLGNIETTQGGVVAGFNKNKVTISNSKLHNNRATYGGAIALTLGDLNIADSDIFDNGAQHTGGGIHLTTSIANVFDTKIHQNHVDERNGKGAAIDLTSESSVNLRRTRVYGNIGGESGCGGIMIGKSNLHILESAVELNQSGGQGRDICCFSHNLHIDGASNVTDIYINRNACKLNKLV